MKKNCLLGVLLIFCTVSFAQVTNVFPGSGNVGIGTSNPQSWFSGKVLEISDYRPILKLSPFQENGLATILFKGAYNSSGGTPDEFHLNYVSSLTNPRIIIGSYFVGGGAAIFSLLGNGNLGIGVEFPTEKLSVKGKIRAQEVKVEAANWPDYVFAKSYQLPTLRETEKHIKEKGHLQGIPSAAEVKTNGVDLGEMNAKLLQKIEELTLYLIEMKKENDHQRVVNTNQEDRLKYLEKIVKRDEK